MSVQNPYIVCIGASAGGLEALEEFFDAVSLESNMAFVVVQHLSPDFKSIMDQLLSRRTSLPIRPAQDNMEVRPNSIYLLPPKKEMIISGGCLRLSDKDPRQGLSLPIDIFMSSLADDAGDHAIGVILSGTGSDGSRGIQRIHEAGGLAIAQTPETAKFNGMPLAARETGVVHCCLPPGEIPDALRQYADNPIAFLSSEAVEANIKEGTEAVFELLRRDFNIDFSHYKPATISRRLHRRVSLARMHSLEKYIDRLRTDAEELSRLYRDLLIGVTQFFRDQDAFSHLEQFVIPRLLDERKDDQEIRVWAAGCATGEEVYSLAILLLEEFQRRGLQPRLKLFASDVHQASLDFAGLGVYSEDRLIHMTPERLSRYFTQVRGGYQVHPDLRRMILFVQHNVLVDAPFTNLDLVSCRNLLIYFQNHAQRKALSMFHYGLRIGGYLFLGPSETPGDLLPQFQTIDDHAKIFLKTRRSRLPSDVRLPLNPVSRGTANPSWSSKSTETTALDVYDQLLDRCMPPSLLVDDKGHLLDSFGGAEKYLKAKARRPSTNLMELLLPQLRPALDGIIQQAVSDQKPVRFSGLHIPSAGGGDGQYVQVDVDLLGDGKNTSRHYLVTIAPTQRKEPDPPAEAEADRRELRDYAQDELTHQRMRELDLELKRTRESLQASIEELETSNEELQASNEELVASNEELQSTNEELHSVNEELYTVNGEHQRKIDELNALHRDVSHLLTSLELGVLFLDEYLCIRRFTPGVAEIFHLLEQDLGRQLMVFSHNLEYPNLISDLRQVLTTGESLEAEISDFDGNIYLTHILPYRIGEEVKGVVLTLTDITPLANARQNLSQLSAIVESSHDAIIATDLNGRVTAWNRSSERLFGYSAQDAIGQDVKLITPPNLQEEHSRLRARVTNGEYVEELPTVRAHKNGQLINVSLRISPIHNQRQEVVGISCLMRDISELFRAHQELHRIESRFHATFDNAAVGMAHVDLKGCWMDINQKFCEIVGYPPGYLIGYCFDEITMPDDLSAERELFQQVVSGEIETYQIEKRFLRQDGSPVWVSCTVSMQRDAVSKQPLYLISIVQDISQQKQYEVDLTEAVDQRDRFIAVLSHELRNPLAAVRHSLAILRHHDAQEDKKVSALHTVNRQVGQMAHLLDDLLDVSRITQGKVHYQMQPLDLRRVVQDAVDAMRPGFEKRKQELTLQLPVQEVLVEGDEARLLQVVANLLTNSCKYTSVEGKIHVQLEVLENRQCQIAVTDNGRGIPPESLNLVFELFSQTDNNLDRREGGMGLGLALVRSLVTHHQGTISAHSDGLGHGSQFVVTLPMTEKPLAREAGSTAKRSLYRTHSSSKKRLVLVEDNEDSRNMLQMLLNLEGFETTICSDGLSGLEVILELRPDIALVDIGLPGLDGYEVARRVREHAPEAPIHLIALTGYGQATDIEKAQQAGFDNHITKPVDPQKLVSFLRGDSEL